MRRRRISQRREEDESEAKARIESRIDAFGAPDRRFCCESQTKTEKNNIEKERSETAVLTQASPRV